MKILIVAIACDPNGFSESYVGWQAVKTLAKLTEHQYWVMTSSGSEASIQKAQAAGNIPTNVHFVFHGSNSPCHPNRLVARLQSWRDYQTWMGSLLAAARSLHDQIGFDQTHHLTYVTWRVACPLWQLGIPLIWGPIGGGETFPQGLLPILSLQARLFERLRSFSNFLSMQSSSVRSCARNAAHVFVVNRETEVLLKRLGVYPERMSTLAGTFFDQERIERFTSSNPKALTSNRLELFAGGNLEGRKGVAIALQALALVAKQGVRFRYTIGGNGPERDFLQKLALQLGIADSVEFTDGFSGRAYEERLATSHIYLLPSLRESAGLTLMEAMLSGCVPIVAHCGGPGEIVTDECGFRIRPNSARQMEHDIVETIIHLADHADLMLRMSSAARERIAKTYTSHRYAGHVSGVYESLR